MTTADRTGSCAHPSMCMTESEKTMTSNEAKYQPPFRSLN